MQLPRSIALIPHLEVLDQSPSTNTELAARGGDDWSVLVTDNQTAGRGRLGREWVSPPGAAIAISVLLRPTLPAGEPLGLDHFGWIPLIAGIAMTRAIAPIVPDHSVRLKWPNDVQVDGFKVAGLLAELDPVESSVVMGAGVNLRFEEGELPTAVSTSLSLLGPVIPPDDLADAVLADYYTAFRELMAGFLSLGADTAASGIADQLAELCSTLGRTVRVELPGGSDLIGTAIDIDTAGRLVVRRSSDGRDVAVAAGDVTHLRYE